MAYFTITAHKSFLNKNKAGFINENLKIKHIFFYIFSRGKSFTEDSEDSETKRESFRKEISFLIFPILM